jgi:hypothetical protein
MAKVDEVAESRDLTFVVGDDVGFDGDGADDDG